MITTDILPICGPGLAEFSFPDDVALIAIGDVHGQTDMLRDLCAGICDLETGNRERHVVFLGDAVDKGPCSLDALEMLHRDLGALTRADRVTLLPGNHDLMMADAVEAASNVTNGLPSRASAVTTWLTAGGLAVLRDALADPDDRSFCDNLLALVKPCDRFEDAFAALGVHEARLTALMPHLIDALDGRGLDLVRSIRSMASHVGIGDVLCVHAGLCPKRPMSESLAFPQDRHLDLDEHWSWIREPFLAHQHGWFEGGLETWRHGTPSAGGKLVLHGHTVPRRWGVFPSPDPRLIARVFDRMETNARICLDFGAGVGVGVGGCLITSEGRRLLFAPSETL